MTLFQAHRQVRRGFSAALHPLSRGWGLVLLAVVLWCRLVPPAHAQAPGAMLTQQQQPVEVTLTPAFQWYESAGQQVYESSVRLRGFVPLTSQWQLVGGLDAARVRAGSGDVLNGIGDLNLGVLHLRPLNQGSLVLRLDTRVPIGTEAFTRSELATVSTISRSIYGFRVPGFGQGARINPTATWALPLNDQTVLGVGVGYIYRGAYRPVAAMEDAYDPGSAMEAFTGVDVSVNEATNVTLDVRYRRYGTDQVGGRNRLKSGDYAAGVLQVTHRFETSRLRAVALHQSWSESEVYAFVVGTDATGEGTRRRLTPSFSLLRVAYDTRVWGFPFAVRGEGRRYGSTIVNGSRTVALVGVRSSFDVADLGEGVAIAPEVEVAAGQIVGVNVGVRTTWEF